MANSLQVFMVEEDERAFVHFLERFFLEVYPRRVPADWTPFRARAADLPRFPQEEIYLVASQIGPALVDAIKRGPDKGYWRVDEVASPVIFWQRCLKNDDGELLSGQVWAELDVTPQTGRRSAAPDQFRTLMLEVDSWLKRTFRKGDPKPYLVGPATARAVKSQSLKLRVNEHKGREIFVHR